MIIITTHFLFLAGYKSQLHFYFYFSIIHTHTHTHPRSNAYNFTILHINISIKREEQINEIMQILSTSNRALNDEFCFYFEQIFEFHIFIFTLSLVLHL